MERKSGNPDVKAKQLGFKLYQIKRRRTAMFKKLIRSLDFSWLTRSSVLPAQR
mgnify:CR=1 FL=1